MNEMLGSIVAKRDGTLHRLELYGGGTIDAWSLDNPNAGRGQKYARVVIDEAAIVKELKQAWELSIRPTLTDLKGSAWFLSTPSGIASYFHTLFQRGSDSSQDSWASWQMPTVANPYIDPEEVEDARNDLTELAYAQEYLAQFVSWEGTVFRKIMDAVYSGDPQGKVQAIGVDWGRTNDYTVFVALSDIGEVVEIDRFRGIEYALQRARLQAFYERHGEPQIFAEANSMGMPVIEQLARDKLKVKPFTTTNVSKSAAIDALALAFERGIIRIPNDPILIGELQAFEAVKLPSSLIRYSAPEGGHDDVVMALAIGWDGLGITKRRLAAGSFIQSTAVGNDSLVKPSSWRGAGSGMGSKWGQHGY